MEMARGMQEAPPKVEEKPEWWATPAVIGLMGFGLTTILAGFSNLPAPYGNGFGGNWVVFGMAMAFGGLVQLIAGVIGLRKGNLFAGSAFVGYGAFWLAFTSMLTIYGNGSLLPPASTVGFYGIAAFTFVWFMFTLTFLINSMKHGWGIFFVFLFLTVAFLLLTSQFWQLASHPVGWQLSKSFSWAVGGEIILTGLTAWFVATADLTNWNYGRRVIPA